MRYLKAHQRTQVKHKCSQENNKKRCKEQPSQQDKPIVSLFSKALHFFFFHNVQKYIRENPRAKGCY